MDHINEIAIQVLKEEYEDYPEYSCNYDREYMMIIKALSYQNEENSEIIVSI